MAAVDVDDVAKRIASHSKYYDDLLSLVPARYYFAKEVEENKWNKYAKNKKSDQTTQRTKKGKQADEDIFDFSKTVPEILLERFRASGAGEISEEPAAATAKPVALPVPTGAPLAQPTNTTTKQTAKSAAPESSDEEGDSQDESDDEMQVDSAPVEEGEMSSFMQSDSRDEARRKLLERINELRKKRKAVVLDDKFKPRADYEAPPSKRRKTTTTGEKADEEDPAGDKKKQQKKNEKPQQNKKHKPNHQNEAAEQADAKNNSKNDNDNDNDNNDDDVVPADIQFGTFDWSSGKPVPTYLAQQRKRPSNHVLLKKAEAEKKKMEELAGTAEGDAMRENKAWDAVMKRAAGEKVKDKPELLKKAIKRKESQKRKSAAKWKERNEQVQKQQEEKQRKRTENIKKALQKKRDKRMGIKSSDSKKGGGKNRPGFEGKKSGFINK